MRKYLIALLIGLAAAIEILRTGAVGESTTVPLHGSRKLP
jgi:hypothetical protein